jgi:metal-responsive CopG/Arc/MetJ family transcriptional regulator
MATALKQANFQLPEDLIRELRDTVGKRGQSKFVSEALRRELQRHRQLKALDDSFGAWNKMDHPELEKGVDHFIRNTRKSSREKRHAK